eukprot:CAMPEP_0180468192 /NCGR_PEP_ID=MMETSP1036_2-20121128/27390_1 /TAXON_ID=632150 /ORGANISM="Azadinium spinosum, Strain 3D9" /LENGTH=158 /DNA_ID=CAMNT_0022475181 /DNA_START=192 /DNA_END=668 /DNA_ORIENTATION=-
MGPAIGAQHCSETSLAQCCQQVPLAGSLVEVLPPAARLRTQEGREPAPNFWLELVTKVGAIPHLGVVGRDRPQLPELLDEPQHLLLGDRCLPHENTFPVGLVGTLPWSAPDDPGGAHRSGNSLHLSNASIAPLGIVDLNAAVEGPRAVDLDPVVEGAL